jgi:hypothetical protein
MSATESAVAPRARVTVLPYAATIFLSAFLLFLVQPIIAKQILPWFGGSSAVWTTALVFFQTTLLAGYAYADAAQRLGARRSTLLHVGLLVVSLLLLPILASPEWKPRGDEAPTARILLLLTATIGLPYFLLSTTTPLLQAWYWRRFHAVVPYRSSRSRILRHCWRCSAFRCCSSRGSRCRSSPGYGRRCTRRCADLCGDRLGRCAPAAA